MDRRSWSKMMATVNIKSSSRDEAALPFLPVLTASSLTRTAEGGGGGVWSAADDNGGRWKEALAGGEKALATGVTNSERINEVITQEKQVNEEEKAIMVVYSFHCCY